MDSEQEMARPFVWHIEPSYDGSVVAVGDFSRRVQIWSIPTRSKIAEFETVLEGGGERLAISQDGNKCGAGAYDGSSLAENRYVGGSVALYDSSNGNLLWQNKKIRRVQTLRFSIHDSGSLLAGFDDQPFHVIDAEDGTISDKLRGVRAVHESPFGNLQLREYDAQYVLFDSGRDNKIGKLPKSSFSTLDVAFGTTSVIVSEAAGTVRCFNQTSCTQKWEYIPDEGSAALRIHYSEEIGEIVCCVKAQSRSPVFESLIWLDEDTGKVIKNKRMEGEQRGADSVFVGRAGLLITSSGDLIDIQTGERTAQIEFPRETD